MLHFKSSARVAGDTPNDHERYLVTLPAAPFNHRTLLGAEMSIDGRQRVCCGFESMGVPEPGSVLWITVETKQARASRLKASEFPRAASAADVETRGQIQPPLFD